MQFFTPDPRLSLPHSTAGLIAAQLGAGIILGTAEHTYRYGWYGFIYPLGLSFGFLLLHHKFAEIWHNLKIVTTAQVFEKVYQSRKLRSFAACIFVMSLFGILCAEAGALQQTFSSLPGTSTSLFIITWIALILYTTLGGLVAVVSTDIIQVLLVYGIFITLTIIFMVDDMPTLPKITTLLTTFSRFPEHVFGIQSIVSLFLLPALFSIIGQELVVYFFHVRSTIVARRAATGSTLLLILFAFIPVLFGVYARVFEIESGINPLIGILGKLFPEIVMALVVCAITAAILSVADSLLCAISNHISHDILRLTNSKKSLIIIRIIMGCMGIIALASVFLMHINILTVLFLAYNLSVSTLFVPIMLALFLPKRFISTYAAWASIITGLLSASFWHYHLFLFHYLPVNLILALSAYILTLTMEKIFLKTNSEKI